MNVETPSQNRKTKPDTSPVDIARNETASTAPTNSNDSPGNSSKESEESAIMDDPNYIQPDQVDLPLTDITSDYLHGNLSQLLGVDYLSVVPEGEATRLGSRQRIDGTILARNTRFVINVPCRRESRRDLPTSPEAAPPHHNVFFVVDTGSPHCYMCKEAMEALLGGNGDDPIPQIMRVEFITGQIVEFHLSPSDSHYSDVNILGDTVLQTTDLFSDHRKRAFSLMFG